MQTSTHNSKVNVVDYQNYRVFLMDYYEHQKSLKNKFTYAHFSKKAGIQSPNYLKLVIDGTKNLTAKNIIRFSKALELNAEESDYYETLVFFNQAKNSLEKEHYLDKLNRIKESLYLHKNQTKTLEEYEFEAVSSWIFHSLLVLITFKHFKETPSWIKERLYNTVSEDEIKKALHTLEKLGLISRDQKTQKLKRSHRILKTKPELNRASARLFYQGLFKRILEDFSLSKPEEREYAAYIVGLSPEQIPELRKKVRAFMNSLNEWALENNNPKQVYSLSFSGVPLTQIDPRHTV